MAELHSSSDNTGRHDLPAEILTSIIELALAGPYGDKDQLKNKEFGYTSIFSKKARHDRAKALPPTVYKLARVNTSSLAISLHLYRKMVPEIIREHGMFVSGQAFEAQSRARDGFWCDVDSFMELTFIARAQKVLEVLTEVEAEVEKRKEVLKSLD